MKTLLLLELLISTQIEAEELLLLQLLLSLLLLLLVRL